LSITQHSCIYLLLWTLLFFNSSKLQKYLFKNTSKFNLTFLECY
jgi:hypothetical protein